MTCTGSCLLIVIELFEEKFNAQLETNRLNYLG
jgi:hypothetical protein